MPRKNPKTVRRIQDRVCIINAFDGFVLNEPTVVKDTTRQRRILYDDLLVEATNLARSGIPLEQLTKAIAEVGWEDQHFQWIGEPPVSKFIGNPETRSVEIVND